MDSIDDQEQLVKEMMGGANWEEIESSSRVQAIDDFRPDLKGLTHEDSRAVLKKEMTEFLSRGVDSRMLELLEGDERIGFVLGQFVNKGRDWPDPGPGFFWRREDLVEVAREVVGN